MSTHSFFHNVNIQDSTSTKALVSALEQAQEKSKHITSIDVPCREADTKMIQRMFQNKQRL